MKELLEQLGFEHITGPMWKHKDIGMIHFLAEDKPTDIVQRIYDTGYSECQLMIRSALGTKGIHI